MPQGPDDDNRKPGETAPGYGPFERDVLALLPQLRRYARSLARSDAEGDDLLQDCVEKALTNRRHWRGINLKAWTYAIMTNLYRNRYRHNARHPAVSIDEAAGLPAAEVPSDPLERDRLVAALDSLPEENRAVLMLVTVEGYGYQEVADMLDLPIGTVMSRLSRARQRLRDQLNDSNIISLRRPR
ncbi:MULTISPECIES: sigma-70 family RNA polymerase sigma factor [Alphaproteobacteria]|uniref:DNA-directed RNA polymerase sigma-70 factor n=2 Tax=Alphaproteobacteria TaxID=28211 RepID=A0A512HMV2_9HYPH|nr:MULTISPECIES: sigma-70 family RNA polymerase sigma factor [Alphaproteobacteria]GEO86773.1 DNA-directed RNA polymerase sigma-70 factor [Ciceribacter naphthalenivorans]GLR23352.1 DNA-directed RNA polymerase sigma-70 factor [Ciceribacter naphthalenivorans]GLT06208.1 DNA-directed RNA polymerase sigma-70 factor [Sphingomonas psychrolutea]